MKFLYSVTIFLGAALLFLVQPMVGKMILPRLGGSPMVWNTCLVFFQSALLAGYLYAYLLDRVKNRAAQVTIHTLVLMLPALSLPVLLPGGWQPSPGESQSLAILRVLVVMAALPFSVVATTGPLLQRWYSLTGAKDAKDPYFLYAASNAGSLLGLLAYPVLVEPTVTLGAQARLWTWGYAAYALLTMVCGIAVLRSRASRTSDEVLPEAAAVVSAWARVKWLVLSMVPSSLSVGATQYISTDVAAIPFLWVLPLSLYLLTFIIAFSRWRVPVLVSGAGLLVCAACTGLVQLVALNPPIWAILMLHLGILFFGALVCHTQLAAMRPAPRHLTQYFLVISLGGVLGGAFNALLAPVIFDSIWEYPIAIVAACLLIQVTGRRTLPRESPEDSPRAPRRSRPSGVHAAETDGRELDAYTRGMIRMGLLMATLAAGGMLVWKIVERDYRGVLHRERTFFGTHAVETTSEGTWHTLRHGTTRHGVQRMEPVAAQHVPRSYFHFGSPIGWMFRMAQDPEFFAETTEKFGATAAGKQPSFKRVAIIGLGAGTLATYSQPGDEYTIYEIDPAVERIARNMDWFTFVGKAKGSVKTVIGDGRLRIAEAPDGAYDLIILDAFTSDAIPYHLLTKEALALYLRKLAPGGVVALHISNLHVDLGPVLAAGARALGAEAIKWAQLSLSPEEKRQALSGSVWCAIAKRPQDLRVFTLWDNTWRPLVATPGYPAWTDDYSNLIRALKNPGSN